MWRHRGTFNLPRARTFLRYCFIFYLSISLIFYLSNKILVDVSIIYFPFPRTPTDCNDKTCYCSYKSYITGHSDVFIDVKNYVYICICAYCLPFNKPSVMKIAHSLNNCVQLVFYWPCLIWALHVREIAFVSLLYVLNRNVYINLPVFIIKMEPLTYMD